MCSNHVEAWNKLIVKQKFCASSWLITEINRLRCRVRKRSKFNASGIITRIGGRLVHQTATYKCDDTRGCVMQFWPPDVEHMCSNHVEAWNKLIVKQKFCASSWLITEINILRCTVRKRSKFNASVIITPIGGRLETVYQCNFLSN